MTAHGKMGFVKALHLPPAGRLSRTGVGRALSPSSGFDIATIFASTILAIAYRYWGQPGHDPTSWVAQLVIAVPLLWRRRFPVETLAVTVLAALGQFAYSGVPPGEVAMLVALYSVGVYERRSWALVGSLIAAIVFGSTAVIALSPTNAGYQTVILLAGTVLAAWITGVYIRTRRAYLNSVLDRAATAERERDQQALTIRAEERDGLSREIHDIVAHNLSVMIALGDGARVAIDRNPKAAQSAMEQSSATGRQALNEIRQLLGALRDHDAPDLGPQPGLDDLDDLVAHVRAADLPVQLIVTGRPPDMSAGAQLTIYRFVQEGLTNVLKHAPTAREARVELCFNPDDVTLAITNDGPPASDRNGVPAAALPGGSASDRPATRSQPGHGLTGMRERAAVFGGVVEAGPTATHGWRVQANLPLPRAKVSNL